MTERNVRFYRVESLPKTRNSSIHGALGALVCSYDTERFGYFQIGRNHTGLKELKGEPDLNVFPKRDREYIKVTMVVAWRMYNEVPAAKQRFE